MTKESIELTQTLTALVGSAILSARRHRSRGTALAAGSGHLVGHPSWIVLMFAGMAFSGCIGSERGEGGVAGSTGEGVELVVRVVSRELFPLVEALVRLNETDVEARTDIEGTVTFGGLLPGTYHVFAEALGYYPATRRVELSFDEADPLVLVLEELPLVEPFHLVFIRNGISSCEVPLVFGWISEAEVCAAAGIPGRSFFNASFEDGWAFASLELTWKGSGWFALWVYPCETRCVRDKIHGYRVGPNPVRLDAFPGETGVGKDRQFYIPFPKGAGRIETFTPYAGEFAEQINAVVPQSACGGGIHDQRCAGVGISFERRFTLYISQFYHQAPADPKNYTALPDS